MLLVYRFQNTKEIETKSYAEDIMNIWFYKGADDPDFQLTEELAEEIYFDWQPFIDHRLSTEEFCDLSPFDFIEKILSFKTEEEAYKFQMKHKLEGVFAINPIDDLQEAFRISKLPELGLGNKYLIIAEADVIEEFPPPFGLLVRMKMIKDIIEVPEEYHKDIDTTPQNP